MNPSIAHSLASLTFNIKRLMKVKVFLREWIVSAWCSSYTLKVNIYIYIYIYIYIAAIRMMENSEYLNLINSKIFTILHHPYCCYIYIPCTTCLHIPLILFLLYYYLLSPQYTILHILLFFIFLILIFINLFYLYYVYIYVYSLVLVWTVYNILHCPLSGPDLHFTTDYILYNWVCDE